MDESKYIDFCEKTLNTPLDAESPDALIVSSITTESLGYLATRFQARSEKQLREAESALSVARAEGFAKATGKTVEEKRVSVEAMIVAETEEVARCESMVKFYRNLSVLIDRRTGLAQSILANYSAQIKAGIITK